MPSCEWDEWDDAYQQTIDGIVAELSRQPQLFGHRRGTLTWWRRWAIRCLEALMIRLDDATSWCYDVGERLDNREVVGSVPLTEITANRNEYRKDDHAHTL